MVNISVEPFADAIKAMKGLSLESFLFTAVTCRNQQANELKSFHPVL